MRFHFFLLLLVIILSVSCANQQEDTCESDKTDGNWQEIVDNDECSDTEKAEAHMALGGFDYYDFILSDSVNLVDNLGMTTGNWEDKKDHFDSAIGLVDSLNSGTEKSIYLLSSFLALYVYMVGTLDSGAGDATAFDGTIDDSEIDSFINTELDSGGSTTELESTDFYQFNLIGETQLYLLDFENSAMYEDNNGDGSGDVSLNVVQYAQILAQMESKGLGQLNQVAYLKSLADPFANSANLNVSGVKEFAETTLGYIDNIQSAVTALGVDASDDAVEKIESYRAALDNGGDCEKLESEPAVLLVQYLADSLQETELVDGDYSDANILSVVTLVEYGMDATFDSSDLSSTYGVSDLGAKVRFLNDTSSDYISYWEDAHANITTTMNTFKEFDNSVAKNDGKVSLSEILCISELLPE